MCYAAGSLNQAVNVCPLCRVFPHPRCPHTREVCRNRTNHPRFDVLFLKNAEVDSFNGCGYCKWAHTNPPPKAAGYYNTGWPGCCRPPTASEHRLIHPADWRSVSLVHHIPIPPDVKALLDNLTSRGSPVPSVSPVRSGPTARPSADRRNSSAGKSASVPIPGKGRSGGSPQMVASSIASNSSRGSGGSGGGGASTSVPTTSTMEQVQKRREILAESEKPPGSSNSSPSRKHIDLEVALLPRRNSGARPPASTVSSSVSKVIADGLTPGSRERRRSVSSTQPSTSSKMSPPVTTKTSSPPVSTKASTKASATARPVDPPRPPKKIDAETSSTSSSGSDSLGSMTESTVTSDGGFTDYLSDESEAELQRQAEAKAALVAQNEAEELEFRAARQALANIGLRPPKSWVATEGERSTARLGAATSTRS
ncbi:hypothetical protein B0H15DRAFT_828795 [Mycena belliarum]|uniref:Uncharacterized protein n=1 Tax=Mycena belliarum TaxID=1033014 RepID=A0AAD6XTU2_9AGAR|nr:hypothetical protein B0H15DRAFT_828795 [Mycena belliae]